MCPPLGHSSARIGPALLMRRAQGRSGGGLAEGGQTAGEKGSWGYREVEISESRRRESLHAHNRLRDGVPVPDDVVCVRDDGARSLRPALLKLLGCAPSALCNLRTLRITSVQTTSVCLSLPISFPNRRLGNPLARLLFTTFVVILNKHK